MSIAATRYPVARARQSGVVTATVKRRSRCAPGGYALLQIAVEPCHRPRAKILRVRRRADAMPLVGIDHQTGRHAEILERMPIFGRLRRRHLDVALARPDKGRRLR